MKIYEKNLFKSLLVNIFYSALVLLIIFGVFKLIDEVAHIGPPDYTFGSVIVYTLFNFPDILLQTLNLSILIGVCVTVAGMNENSEIIALNSASVSKTLFAFKVIKYSVMICILTIIILEFTSPTLLKIGERYKSVNLGSQNSLIGEENIWLRSGNKFLSIGRNINGQRLENLNIIEANNGQIESITSAKKAEVKKSQIQLFDVKKKFFIQTNNLTKIVEGSTKNESNQQAFFVDEFGSIKPDPRKLSLFELISKTIYQINNGMESRSFKIELYSRIFQPINLISILLLTIPMLFKNYRSRDLQKKLLIAISTGIAFNLLSKIFSVVATKIDSGIILSSLAPAIIFFVIGLFLFRKKVL